MGQEGAALRLALDLLHVPWRVRIVRKEVLPAGVALLLRVAAGDAAAEEEAVAAAGRPLEVVRQAATFFIEQILLAPDSDSYRVLGTSSKASDSELRRNMASLMTWLHPDKGRREERSIFVPRIAQAWNDLKTPERRAAYDTAQRAASSEARGKRMRSRGGLGPEARGKRAKRSEGFAAPQSGGLWRALSLLFLGRRNFRGPRY
jgi:hypothetical protein